MKGHIMTRFKRSALSLMGCAAVTFCCFSLANAGKPDRGKSAYTIIPFAPDGVTVEATSVLDLNEFGEAVGYVWNANVVPWESYHVDLVRCLRLTLPSLGLCRQSTILARWLALPAIRRTRNWVTT